MHIQSTLTPRVQRLVALSFALLMIALVVWTPTLFGQTPAFKVLVYSEIPSTQPYHRDSIPAGVTAIEQLAQANNFSVEVATNVQEVKDRQGATSVYVDPTTVFTAANLAKYRAVIFLSPNSDQLNNTEQAAFEQYIRAGGGLVGVHGAASFERRWAWYRQALGANFINETPPFAQAFVDVVNPNHPSTQGLQARIQRDDEWYNLTYGSTSESPAIDAGARAGTQLLVKVDESTYNPGSNNMGDPHPVSWYQAGSGFVNAGRVWVTTMGHYPANYSENYFRKHLLGGILWAAGGTNQQPTTTATTTATITTTPRPFPNKEYAPRVEK